MKLEQRFLSYLRSRDDIESIDDDIDASEFNEGRRADFLARDRSLLTELKTLKSDTSHKVQERLDRHKNREEFPLFYWEAKLDEVLAGFPDAYEIKRDIVGATTRPVSVGFMEADKQIRETKTALQIEDACGLLIVLNDTVEILSPDVIVWEIQKMMNKTKKGAVRYPNVTYVIVVSETHSIHPAPTSENHPIFTIEGPLAVTNSPGDLAVESIAKGWAKYENAAFVPMTGFKTFDDVKFDSLMEKGAEETKQADQLSRQELWRKRYRAQPYMRHLSKEEFLVRSERLIRRLFASKRKGSGSSFSEISELFEDFTGVLEEAEYRRIDMKRMINQDCPYRKLHPGVSVVQSTEFRD